MLSKFAAFLNERNSYVLSQYLLHSSKIELGERYHYGTTQQKALMANWLKSFAELGEYQVEHEIVAGNYEVALIKVVKGTQCARFVVSIYHYQNMIKDLLLTVDRSSLQQLSEKEEREWWPVPDPLILSDFDQQCHPKTIHAKMVDFIADSPLLASLERWWHVWQVADIAEIGPLYADSQFFAYNGQLHKTQADKQQFLICLEGLIQRRYSQLEQVLVQGNKAFIRWRIDGDRVTEKGVQRVRLKLNTVIQFNSKGGILFEQWVHDDAAFKQRFTYELEL